MGQLCCKKNLEYVDSNDVNIPTVPTWKVVISLVLIFAVYVGVQVTAQAYPVLIPIGIRCYQNYSCQSDEKNISVVASTSSPSRDCRTSVGCIEFNDAQQGVLTGLTFTMVYLIAGIPFAKAARVGSSVILVGVSQLFLIGMAVITAVSDRFLVLWIARLGVGIGEAACIPACYSLISDYFLAMNKAKALSLFYFATNLGVAVAYMLGMINAYVCWRGIFYGLAISGGFMFLLILVFLREPPHESWDSLMNSHDIYTVKETFHRLTRNKTYVVLCLATSARYVSIYALWAWLPTFYAKVLQVPSEDYSVAVAFVILTGGGVGCILGGILADRMSRRRRQYKVYMIAASQLAAAIFILVSLLVLSPAASFGMLFLGCLAAEIAPGPAASVVQDLFSVNLSTQATGVYIAVSNITGGALGPLLVPAIVSFNLSWHYCGHGVGISLAIIVPIFYLLASVLYLVTSHMMPTDPILNEETIYLKYETSEVDPDSDSERETNFYGSL